MYLFRSRQRCVKLLIVLLPSTKALWTMPVDSRIWLKGQLLTLPQSCQRCADTRVVADQADGNHLLLMAGQRSDFRQLPIRLDRAIELGRMIGTNRQGSSEDMYHDEGFLSARQTKATFFIPYRKVAFVLFLLCYGLHCSPLRIASSLPSH